MTDPLRLRPGLSPANYADAYARDGIVQIERPLAEAEAEALAAALEQATPWALVHSDEMGRHAILDPTTLGGEANTEARRRVQALLERATNGFAYLYLAYPMSNAYLAGRDPGHPLHRLTQLLHGPEFTAFATAVTGAALTKADAQATLFRPGCFLTRHNDGGLGGRRVAYTLSFTRRWRPDWGGQLLFHDDAGGICRGLSPRLNVLTLFKVPLWHSVAPVAAYAAAPRLTVTGWLRD